MLKLTNTVCKSFGKNKREHDDLLGVEIELEGQSSFPHDIDNWVSAQDGSLKSDYSIEYVLNKPMLKDKCFAAIEELFGCIKKYGPCSPQRRAHDKQTAMDLCYLLVCTRRAGNRYDVRRGPKW
ncbi:MAG: hypothetical protein ACXABD_21480 [Candidatus Thorarchaeota archaeon]|jgi:hypothetical protein